MANIVNQPPEGDAQDVTEPVSTIPENLQGKSAEELAEMLQNREKTIGRQGEELGQLRSLVEQQIAQTPAQAKEADGEVDFYEDPNAFIERKIQQALRPLEAERTQNRMQAAKVRLDTEHPGWEDVAKNEDFQNWVAKSQYRVNLFAAGNVGDYSAADELFSTWKEIGKSKGEVASAAEKAVKRDRKVRAIRTEKGASNIDPRKILSRSDLRELRMSNPQRYNELLPEIRQAYAEGRVK